MSIIDAIQSAIGGIDAAGAEIFEHVGSAELRHPGIVQQIDVILTGAVLGIGEPLLEGHAIFVLEELDIEARFGLGQRNDLLLEGREAAIGEGADDDLAAGRPGDRRGSQGRRERRCRAPHAAPALSSLRRLSCRFSSSRRVICFPPLFGARCTTVEPDVSKKQASAGSKVDADGGADSGAEAAPCPHRHRLLADADVDQRLVAHRLDHVDFAD